MLAIPKSPAGMRTFQRNHVGDIVQTNQSAVKPKNIQQNVQAVSLPPSVNWDLLTLQDKKDIKKLYDANKMDECRKIIHKITSKDFCVGCGGLGVLQLLLEQQIPLWKLS